MGTRPSTTFGAIFNGNWQIADKLAALRVPKLNLSDSLSLHLSLYFNVRPRLRCQRDVVFDAIPFKDRHQLFARLEVDDLANIGGRAERLIIDS